MNIKEAFKFYKATGKIDKKKVEKLILQACELEGFQSPVIVWVKGPREANIAGDVLDKLSVVDYLKAPNLITKAIKSGSKPTQYRENVGGGQFVAGVISNQQKYFEENPDKFNELNSKGHEKELKKYEVFSEIGKHASLWYQWERVIVCVERPTINMAKLNEENGNIIFHCENGPVFAWADGSKYFFLNHVRVPSWLVIDSPKKLLKDQRWLKEKNIEIQREILRKITWPKLVNHYNAKLIDTWSPTLAEMEYAHNPGKRVSPYKLMEMEIVLPVNGSERRETHRGVLMNLEDKDRLASEYFEFIKDKTISSAKDAFFANRVGVPRDRKIILS